MSSRPRFAPALPPQTARPDLLERLAARWVAGWKVHAQAYAQADQVRARLPWPVPGDLRVSLEREPQCCG
jgi:hypothetical protein